MQDPFRDIVRLYIKLVKNYKLATGCTSSEATAAIKQIVISALESRLDKITIN